MSQSALTVIEQVSLVDDTTPDAILQTLPTTVVLEVNMGPQGPQGIQGPVGGFYEYVQVSPSASWIITHNLGRYPAVTVIDATGNVVLADVIYGSVNQATITFASPVTGTAEFVT